MILSVSLNWHKESMPFCDYTCSQQLGKVLLKNNECSCLFVWQLQLLAAFPMFVLDNFLAILAYLQKKDIITHWYLWIFIEFFLFLIEATFKETIIYEMLFFDKRMIAQQVCFNAALFIFKIFIMKYFLPVFM